MMQHGGDIAALTQERLAELRWLLHADSPGYDTVFRRLAELHVIGTGRWGEGDFIFGPLDALPDITGPMTPVFAYGVIEYPAARRTITVHDEEDGQIEVQFAISGHEHDAHDGTEIRRYSWSEWQPGAPSPERGESVREVRIDTAAGQSSALAVCAGERKLWYHDPSSRTNRLLPPTAFYSELMRVLGEKRPDRALAPRRLFTEAGSFTDGDLVRALHAYNTKRGHLQLPPFVEHAVKKVSLFKRVFGT